MIYNRYIINIINVLIVTVIRKHFCPLSIPKFGCSQTLHNLSKLAILNSISQVQVKAFIGLLLWAENT